MKQYNAIIISDVHMGTKHAQVDKLLTFLKETECRHLYIVGDLIDGWELKRKWYWDDTHNLLVQKLLRKSRHHTNITYITGNHDEFVEQFIGQNFGGVKIMKKTMHTGVHGKRYLVMHGHQFDGLVHCGRLLERIGSAAYQYVLSANTFFNKLRRRFGFGYWSLARFVKMNTKRAVKFITDFEDGMVSMARAKKVDGIICGQGRLARTLRCQPACRHAHDQSQGVRRIGYIAYQPGKADYKPDQQHGDRTLVKLQAESGIVVAANPYVSKEGVVHAGHASKGRAA